MLNELRLKNFRQHQDRTFNFAAGLNALRGANEIGKTSTLESISYALFGTKSLRDSLENVVTWGKPVKDLKVELDGTFHGRQLTFTRGKSGAEVIEGGKVIVTGQNEVSAFAADMLGGDLATCNKLLFANQGSLRGALEEGNKALSELIEGLADFDLFDRLLDLISHKLVVGSPDVLQARLQQLEANIPQVPEKPAESTLPKTIAKHLAKAETEKASVDADIEAYQTWYNEKSSQIHARQEYESAVIRLADDTLKALQVLDNLKSQPKFATTPVEPLRDQLAAALKLGKVSTAYQMWQKRPVATSMFEGDRAEFDAELAEVSNSKVDAQVAIADRQGEIKVLQAKVINALTCPTCGSTLKDADDIKRRNEQYASGIAALSADVAALQAKFLDLNQDEQQYKLIRTTDNELQNLASSLMEYCEVDLNQVPRNVAWVGPTTFNLVDIKALEASIKSAEATNTRAAMQAGALAEAEKTLTELQQTVLTEVPAVEEYSYRLITYGQQLTQRDLLVKTIADLKSDLRVAEAEAKQRMAEFEAKMTAIEAQSAAKKQLEQDLGSLSFNNGLLKKVRAARPQVADKLWNTVLASVSQMFTQMRGEASTITKSKDGFACNGAPISSLSGSTLDLLALAIRCSLTRTFLPQANFMLCDEISAACDADRTLTMLGFLSAAGFQQVLLVSHEEVVDTLADTLIQL